MAFFIDFIYHTNRAGDTIRRTRWSRPHDANLDHLAEQSKSSPLLHRLGRHQSTRAAYSRASSAGTAHNHSLPSLTVNGRRDTTICCSLPTAHIHQKPKFDAKKKRNYDDRTHALRIVITLDGQYYDDKFRCNCHKLKFHEHLLMSTGNHTKSNKNPISIRRPSADPVLHSTSKFPKTNKKTTQITACTRRHHNISALATSIFVD